MPFVHNPAPFSIWCIPAEKPVPAKGKIEVSAEVAAKVSPCVFIVEDGPAEADASEPKEKPTKATPTRKTAKRGGQDAEVTGAPEVETR